jgi:ribosomal protein L13E
MHHIKAQIVKQDGKKRDGKGFSKSEIQKAGLDAITARKMGLPVDPRRKSMHEENVAAMKAHAAKEKAKPKPAPKPKPVQSAKKEKPKS